MKWGNIVAVIQPINNYLLLKPVTERTISLGGQELVIVYDTPTDYKKADADLVMPKCEMVEVVAMPEYFENKWIVGEYGNTTLSKDERYINGGLDFTQPEFRVGATLIASKGTIDLGLKHASAMGYELHPNLEGITKYFFEKYTPLRTFFCAVEKDGIRPLGYNVIAEPIEEKPEHSLLETVAKKSTHKSRVVNPGKCHWLKKGDIVITQDYSHYTISTGKEFYYCYDGVVDVVGVIKN